jgi:hypothetical protein
LFFTKHISSGQLQNKEKPEGKSQDIPESYRDKNPVIELSEQEYTLWL